MSGPASTDAAIDLQLAWREGARALREGRAQEALIFFHQIVEAGPATGPVWIGIAIARQRLGDAAGERTALAEALRLDPNDLRALLMTADHHAAAGDVRAADAFYLAFANLAEATGDPALQAEAARVQQIRARYTASYEARLRRELEGFGLDQPYARRMRRAVDLLVGKSQLYLQQPRNFYFPELPNIEYAEREAFPWLDRVEAATDDIRAELLRVLEEDGAFAPYVEPEPDRPQFDEKGLVGNPDWSAFYLWKAGKPVAENLARCPAAMAALADAPLCRIPGRTPSIHFSLLQPGMHIAPHHGFMNARYICHLPLIVPDGCAMRVGSQTRSWTEGRACVFDDSIEHEAWNRNSNHLRVVLIFDIWRPELTEAERDFVSSILGAVDAFGAEGSD